ncbi:MAG: ParB N-terminal domain-containing protein [Desulfofustis sp. PB-SRB1]|nr:ParB N-terminal domain-containing protein [Desulfofustis sp. PB-SRB1]
MLIPRTVPLTVISSLRRWSLHQDIDPAFNTPLVDSIGQFGIIHPPIMRKEGEDTFELICGANRMAIAHQLNLTHIVCLEVDVQASPDHLLGLILEDQRRGGDLSVMEKARFHALCDQYLDHKKARAVKARTDIGKKSTHSHYSKLLELELLIRNGLHYGHISERSGFAMSPLATQDRLALAEFFVRFQVGANKQLKFIDTCKIISATRQCSIADIFNDPELISLVAGGQETNIPQTVDRIAKALNARAHPLSVQAKGDFDRYKQSLGLPTHCTITPSQAFENDTVWLNVAFSSRDSLNALWPQLRPLLAKKV